MSTSSRPLPYPLGVTLLDDGISFAIYSETADSVDFCSFDESGAETATRLTERTGHVFHGFVPGVGVGTRYGVRVDGPWNPAEGIRHNHHKLLLDPHATAIEGDYTWGQTVFGHDMNEPETMDQSDSAASTPRCVITDPAFDWNEGGPDVAPRTLLSETVIYETHVKGFTKLHPDVPEGIRGTYAGLGHPAAIKHFTDLGITAVELMPVHQFVQDSHLLERDLRNYWGYNSIGFFAPHGEYSSVGDGGGQVAEFKQMVKNLHAAGLEVILDVVYNHTAEGNHMGPTLSFKGIDNGAYYRLVEDDRANYFDTTGTGNSLNVGHPTALGLIMDSLRYWVTEMHVDGFRFDLATTLTRQGGDAELHSAFLTLIQQDPVLAAVKMIAEPWDTAGYQVGGFPADWSEWNGKFRDDVRDFWHGSDGILGTLSQRVLGSPDVYESDRRSPLSSINFVTAHDGFTLADLTAYNNKHNSANGEDNNDGESDNKSSNGGAEGSTDNEAVNERRGRLRRNFLATLLLSAGVPMLLGGDEMCRTQGGNNNAYCQDNEISWFDWANADRELLAFTTSLITLRRENPALHPAWFRSAPSTGDENTVVVERSDAEEFSDEDWENPDARSIVFLLENEGTDAFALLLNAAENGVEFQVPDAPNAEWELAVSSDPDQHVAAPVSTLIVRDCSFTLLRSRA
ncbi:glycogen debranching protein GlgX [Subtercola boreus]|uniref:Glycogen debranching enzyme GlgX n=1 Tax=Subtercola boreus TaxID=120213 RepID=A0A3E0WAR8_9MICO|nr:glycogen debranching protein GlgX [Subtercola boreus]RFA21124.1 glycogen debranching enzyme GlgX [Subtercola boreus]RFA21507.1 glycogen debranching enzyme GlgX [Subtercola boreus]RFA27477.1 glycogen debranching enzyme GlgX [Subtercola boreus]